MITLMRVLILIGGMVLALDTCRSHSEFSSLQPRVLAACETPAVVGVGQDARRR